MIRVPDRLKSYDPLGFFPRTLNLYYILLSMASLRRYSVIASPLLPLNPLIHQLRWIMDLFL